jgi:hypothetical protein
MECLDWTEQLLAADAGTDRRLAAHLTECTACASVARGLDAVDRVLQVNLVVAPPLDLQRQLAQLVLDVAVPQPVPWWRRLGQVDLTGWLAPRPQVLAAQGLAAIMLALASWQVLGVMSNLQPVLGDVGYAVQLVAASPATAYLSNLQIDVQSLSVWSLVGVAGWLVSEDGLLGRRFWPSRRQPPE